jgi:hypothetical protein
MRYTDLDRRAQYRVRVVYVGGNMQALIRLQADDRLEVHPLIKKEIRPMEFDIPREATADGELTLTVATRSLAVAAPAAAAKWQKSG